jgi:hypothetical protein
MNGRPIPIFYEDDRSDLKEVGLHELMVSCIADEWGRDWWELRGRFAALPMKGDTNLLAACEQDVPDMPDPLIFAIFDADKLHRRLFESGKPSEDEILAALRRRCSDPRLHVFLLVNNTESVVDAVTDCLGLPRLEKNKLQRDLHLNRAARYPREHRDCVRAAVPSFDHCVRQIAELSQPHH